MSKIIDETGHRYGRLTVIEYAGSSNKKAMWRCKCDCGREKIVAGSYLRSGFVKSCGCLRNELSSERMKKIASENKNPANRVDLSGQKFGKLTVLGEPQKGDRGTVWKCRCDCGNFCYKVSTDLVRGAVKSCGCLKAELHSTMNDLTGQQFGLLTALYTDKVDNWGQRIWRCKCSCGREVDVRAGNLRKGWTTSCDCKKSKGNLIIDNFLKKQKIQYTSEYSFPDLLGDRNGILRFDFALYKSQKLIGLIEYNGEQHYRPVSYFGGEEGFQAQVHQDKRKIEYCNSHNIPLYIIKYDEDITKRLEEILDELYS